MKERKGKIHTEEVEERSGLEPGPLGNRHSWEKGVMASLCQAHLCWSPEDQRHLSTQPHGDPGPISPWSMCLAERGVMAYFPKEQQAPLLSCIYPSARAGPSPSTPGSLMSQLCLTPVQCSLTEGLLLLLLQHCGVWGFPRSSVCPWGTHLPDWMERFCPTYFISSGGPWSHRQRAAHASAALASRSSHTWPRKGRGQAGVLASQRREEEEPAPLCCGSFLSTHERPKSMVHASG